MNSFTNFLKKTKGKKVLILTHKAADIDAIASAAVLQKVLKNPKAVIGVPGYLNQQAKTLAEKFSLKYQANPIISTFEALILEDFNNLGMIGSEAPALEKFKGPVFLIDHHSENNEFSVPKQFTIKNPKAVSTTQILYNVLKNSKMRISSETSQLLAAGIIADSNFLQVADAQAFQDLAELLKACGKDFAQIVELFSIPKDVSERIAALKAAKRVQLFKSGDFIIAASEVSCFENLAADSLISLGADLAFVGFADEKQELRVSGRASESFLKKTSINLAENVFQPLEDRMQGFGGGHAGAAAFNGTGSSAMQALQECVNLSVNFLKEKGFCQDLKQLKD